MIITKYFVFIHIPKTGGTFVRNLCEQHLPPEWFLDPEDFDWGRARFHGHLGYDSLPKELRDLPALCYVRNPWDWYVSSYHHTMADTAQQRTWLWQSLFGGGDFSFEEMVKVSCQAAALEHPTGQQPGWLRKARELDCDWYSAVFWVAAGAGLDMGRLEVGRFEALRQDLASFIERHEVPVPEDFLRAVERADPLNASPRERYQGYYDDQLGELVGQKARRLIGEFGYTY